jgi:hypothetical protein
MRGGSRSNRACRPGFAWPMACVIARERPTVTRAWKGGEFDAAVVTAVWDYQTTRRDGLERGARGCGMRVGYLNPEHAPITLAKNP